MCSDALTEDNINREKKERMQNFADWQIYIFNLALFEFSYRNQAKLF